MFAFQKHMANSEFRYEAKCAQGIVQIHFTSDFKRFLAAFGKDVDTMSICSEERPDALPLLADLFHVVISTKNPKKQISARFAASEITEVLKGVWPCDSTFQHLVCKVNDRRNFPIAQTDISSSGGRSSAQGQTKKDGSHSQDRHR